MCGLAMTRGRKEDHGLRALGLYCEAMTRDLCLNEKKTTAGESRVYTGRGLSISHLVAQVRIFWRTVRIYRAARACLYSSVLRASPGPFTTDQRKIPALSITNVPRMENPRGSKKEPYAFETSPCGQKSESNG